MKKISSDEIYEVLKPELLRMNVEIPPDVLLALQNAEAQETGKAKTVLSHILKNIEIAGKRSMPMCQDTGLVIVFVEIGREVFIEGPSIDLAIKKAIAEAYAEGYFRKSVVSGPLKDRTNTGTNLPPAIYYDFVDGGKLKISCLAKGFGSENYSITRMLKPGDDKSKIIETIVDAMKRAKGNPCPPVFLGVGIGGTMDWAARISKKALLRKYDEKHPDPFYAELENEALEAVNALGIGGGGLGGIFTALSVKIETYPTHIAGLPVAVSVNCWAERRAEVIL